VELRSAILADGSAVMMIAALYIVRAWPLTKRRD
jgi:hypothetical protein